jgi:hypothetical protein
LVPSRTAAKALAGRMSLRKRCSAGIGQWYSEKG